MSSVKLSPELAHRDPDLFLDAAAMHMAATTELGALAWNEALENGTLGLSKVEVSSNQWHSQSSGSGRLILGAAPMDESMKAHVVYMGENLTYSDEVSRRLLHELGHGALFKTRQQPAMKQLYQLSRDVRNATPDSGLSALGSLDYYVGANDKAIEDTTELLTMRMVSSDHIDGYLSLLRDSRYQEARDNHGLATLEDTAYLRNMIEAAVGEVFA